MSERTLPALAQAWRAAYTRDTPCVPWTDHGEVLADLARRRGWTRRRGWPRPACGAAKR